VDDEDVAMWHFVMMGRGGRGGGFHPILDNLKI